MTTVAHLRSPVPRRNRAVREVNNEDFRDDVVRYGVLLYESLRQRRDFDGVREHDGRRKAVRLDSD